MNRRSFLVKGLAASAAAAISTPVANGQAVKKSSAKGRFKPKYAPHFGSFTHHSGNDMIDRLRFMADEGFTAFFDNGLMKRTKAEQNAIAKELDRLGMTPGPFVAYADFKVK